MGEAQDAIGVVAIGRNEGVRLQRCLASLAGHSARIVYVDSGSTDGSVESARRLGVEVVDLDSSLPFSAARARNVGFDRLLLRHPEVGLVQFVDGDCEVHPEWLAHAARALCEQPDVAIVCGRRRERHPEQSVYNALCDIEWDTPPGTVYTCGGDFLVRARVFREVGGFDPTVIAGEEPELCYRIRQRGGRILRIDREMTSHDAAMTSFRQWWRRSKRAGYAYLRVASLHWREPERIWVRQVISVVAWGLLLPAALLAGAFLRPLLWLALLYPWLAARAIRGVHRARNLPPRLAAAHAISSVLGKFAQTAGVLACARDLMRGRHRRIIEYKQA